jgi:hypothetical protein
LKVLVAVKVETCHLLITEVRQVVLVGAVRGQAPFFQPILLLVAQVTRHQHHRPKATLVVMVFLCILETVEVVAQVVLG